MLKNKFFFYSLLLPIFVFSLHLQALELFDITAEGRVAYYHPSSSKVRRIYGDGWADYQLELSTGIFCGLRAYAGISGFSRKGDSIGFHDHTKLQLIPISLGLKYYLPIFPCIKAYLGGAVCYSLLRIKDDSEYVHEHTHKQQWGGIIQSGLSYSFLNCAVVSVFADYFFQRFNFSDSHESSYSGSSYYYDSRYIERTALNLSGYKLGVGLGVSF